jgi:hypothetical protein
MLAYDPVLLSGFGHFQVAEQHGIETFTDNPGCFCVPFLTSDPKHAVQGVLSVGIKMKFCGSLLG